MRTEYQKPDFADFYFYKTVERFSSYLETANLIFFVRRFSYSLKEQEKSQRMVYSIDVGLSN